MFLLYLDESGVPEPHSSQTTHFVLMGLALHEGTWFALTRLVEQLKRRYGIEGRSDYELHAASILDRYREQEEINGFEQLSPKARREAVRKLREQKRAELSTRPRKRRGRELRRFKDSEPFLHLTRAERHQLVADALDIVAGYRRGLYLFGEAINKETLSASIDPVEEGFTQLVSRFETFLKQRRRSHWGLLALDRNDQQAKRLPRLLGQFQQSGTKWTPVERVIETPFFFDSRVSSGVQVVDLCAYAVRRYLEKGEEALFGRIFPKFYRHRGKLAGLRHFTAKGCSCRICAERGHS